MELFPSEIIQRLREIAEECEKGERDPITGISTWPKEITVEWQAADLIEEYKKEIDAYENFYNDIGLILENFKVN